MMKKNKRIAFLAATFSWVALGACNEVSLAFGDVNSIIVAADPELWDSIGAPLVDQLEQTVFTVRNEKMFKVTHQDPSDEDWLRLRRFKQELVIGKATDPWVEPALKYVDEALSPPQILQTYNVWARNQTVTVLLLPDDAPAAAVLERLPEIAEMYDDQYRDHVLSKMFVTGADSLLAERLRQEARFNLIVPQVYRHSIADPDTNTVHIFRNDNPDPSELIRQVAVTWKSPIPEGYQPEDLLEWRSEIVEKYYNYPQVVNLDNARANPGEVRGNQAYNLQAVWENPPDEWPAAGPFITRAVICHPQDRMYLIDAWLYAPEAEKYEYMIQLEEIIKSFDCNGL